MKNGRRAHESCSGIGTKKPFVKLQIREFMHQLFAKITSSILLISFLVSYCDMFLVVQCRSNLTRAKSSDDCGLKVCCCSNDGHSGVGNSCDVKALSALYHCSLAPSNCDPERPPPQFAVNKDIVAPLPSVEIPCLPSEFDFIPVIAPIHLSDYNVSVFHPPQA